VIGNGLRLLLSLVLVGALVGEPGAGGSLARGFNGLAATPAMGWNNYNAYGLDVTDDLIRRTADAMVSSGLRDAGYRYVNIDDGWMAPARDAAGRLQADSARFPDGIAAVADYVHARGLLLGIYADAGLKTCGGRPGSLGHERADAASFAAWGVDYVKYDNCYAGPGCDQTSCADGAAAPAQDRYAAMRDALLATGRPILFSICNWGTEDVSRWGAGYGNSWRTTGDIAPTYTSMLSIFKQTVSLGGRGGPHGWNDPDMLEVGNGMTAVEDRTSLSLWAMMAAPLILGTDLISASPETVALLTNRDVIAIDQDPLGQAATVVSSVGGTNVLSRPLANGDTAVALFNETDAPVVISTPVPGAQSAIDLWSTTSSSGRTNVLSPGASTQPGSTTAPSSSTTTPSTSTTTPSSRTNVLSSGASPLPGSTTTPSSSTTTASGRTNVLSSGASVLPGGTAAPSDGTAATPGRTNVLSAGTIQAVVPAHGTMLYRVSW
jgi:alpha-galactosidase